MKKLLLVSLCFLMLSITQVFAQNRTVTGTVTAKDDGTPIPGVSVKIKGTTNGVATNSAGKYSISAPPGSMLVFTAIGYTTTESTPKGAVLNISLGSQSTTLGEVVVTGALGIQTQARTQGYSTAQISNKELTEAKVTDISTGLTGKVSGLVVDLPDNGVDPTTRIILRGNRSLTGNNQALLVVDGVPIDDDSYINTINPEDVSSVTVLKGATAAAIYGSKASNGVLIITTKKGTKGRTAINVSNTTMIQSVSYMPALQTQFGAYGGEGAPYTNADGTTNPVPYENQQYGPAFNGSNQPLALSPIFAADGTVTGYDTLYNKYSAIKNNRRDFFQNGLQNQVNLGVDMGTDNSTLHLGAQDVNTKGVVPEDSYHRDNLRIGGTATHGKFTVEYNVSYDQSTISTFGPGYNQSSGGFTGDNLYFDVLNVGANIPLTSFKDLNSKYGNVNSYYNAYAINPYWTIQNSRQNTVNYNWLGNMNLSLKLTPWLTISDRLGITAQSSDFDETRAGIDFAPWAVADPWNAGNVPSSLGVLIPVGASQQTVTQRLNNDFILAFDKKISKDFSITGIVGANLAQNFERFVSVGSNDLQIPNIYNVGTGVGIPEAGQGTYTQRESAIYEEATLGFKNFLFLHFTNRDEWNSVLAYDKNHYEYPGVDASFVFTDGIPSLKNNSVLSYGKIKAAFTQVSNINLGGSNPFGAYSLATPYVVGGGFPFGTLGGFDLSGTKLNPDLKPETNDQFEVGAELGFLQDRIHFNATLFHTNSKNQTLLSNTSYATGYNAQYINAGLVVNTGEEIDLTVVPVKSNNFNWNLGFTFAHYSNIVKELQTPTTQQDEIGGPIYAVKGKQFPVIETYDWNRDPKSGKVIVDPSTGYPSVSTSLTTFGTTNPNIILGITNTFQYKQWTLSFVWDYRGGNEIFNTQGNTEAFTGVSEQSAQNGRQRFIYPNSVVLQGGQYVNNTSVAVENGGNIGGQGFWPSVYTSSLGSIYVDNGDFWKLREANLTYAIPAKALSGIGFIKKASISLLGRNLLMFRPKSNQWTDPEFSDAGTGNAVGETSTGETPPTRFYGANITLTF